nr:hypothetical protein CFP56_21237 [Quercus suber]
MRTYAVDRKGSQMDVEQHNGTNSRLDLGTWQAGNSWKEHVVIDMRNFKIPSRGSPLVFIRRVANDQELIILSTVDWVKCSTNSSTPRQLPSPRLNREMQNPPKMDKNKTPC